MLSTNEIAALAIRVLVNFLTGNLEVINSRLGSALAKFKEENEVSGDPITVGTLFSFLGLRAIVVIRGKVSYIDIHVPGKDGLTTVYPIKLGKAGFDPINKRVLNEIAVMFHRDYKDMLPVALEVVRSMSRGWHNPTPLLGSFTFIDRLIGRQKRTVLKTKCNVDDVLVVEVSATKTIFGKSLIKVGVSTELNDQGWIIEGLVPVHFGALREFVSHSSKDPVWTWVQSVVEDHVSSHLA